MKPSREEQEAQLEELLREYVQKRSESGRPPANRHVLEQSIRKRQLGAHHQAVHALHDKRARSDLWLGTASDSGSIDIRPMQQALAAREAARLLEQENALLRQREREHSYEKLKFDIVKFVVLGILAAAGAIFVSAIRAGWVH